MQLLISKKLYDCDICTKKQSQNTDLKMGLNPFQKALLMNFFASILSTEKNIVL